MTDVRTVSTGELLQRLDRDSGLHLWNVESDQRFSGELIPGSRRMPLDALEPDTITVRKGAEIVTYCESPDCPEGTQAARRLADLGYTNVRAYEEGLDGWRAAGLPTVTPYRPPAT